MRKAKAAVFVATPTYNGSLVHQYLVSYQASFLDCMRRDIVLAPEFAAQFSLVQFARNWLVHQFMQEPAFTHLMWIDADLGWDRTAISRLVESGKDIIGGSYTTKSPTKPVYPFVACGPVENGIQEVSALPGGFILMSRKAVEALVASVPTIKMEHSGVDYEVPHVCDLELVTETRDGKLVGRLLGEDYVMQMRLRALGFKMYMMTDVSFVHVGLHEFQANVAKAYECEEREGLKTMWHPEAWGQADAVSLPERTEPALLVPEQEVPTPHTLDAQKIFAEAKKS